jgi:S1-C subfamily serine protease
MSVKWVVVIVALITALTESVQGDEAAQVLKQSKAATALVVLPEGRGSGSAFCVESSGLFITNAHVVKSVGQTEAVTLVLNPGEAAEKVFRAKVVAADIERDLAMLQSTEGKDFVALTIGSVQNLTETQQLTALGFPFGSALSVKNRKYPNISVNIVRISSLRKSGNAVEAIQVDSQLNPGNSGGPVVDAKGKVIGAISSGIVGGGINFAIPANVLSNFLSTPRIVFTPPNIPEEKRAAPYDLTVGIVTFDKDKTPLTVQIVINPGTPREQTVSATPTGAGQFKARVIPSAMTNPAKLRVAITLSDGLIRSAIDDQTIKLDDRDFKLSELSQLERSKSEASVTLHDGSVVKGKGLTISSFKATIAGQTVPIDPAKIEKIVVSAAEGENLKPQYKVVVKRQDKVLAEEIRVAGGAAATAGGTDVTKSGDPILARLDEAKEEHRRMREAAKRRLLDVLDARAQSVADRGDLDALKSIEAVKQSVEADEKLPEGTKDAAITGAMNSFTAEVKRSNARLAAAYQQAVRDYTRVRKTAEAEAVKVELTERGLDTPTEIRGGFVKLGGSNRLPSFLEPSANTYSEGKGLQVKPGTGIRTKEGNWLEQDFTLDIVYSYTSVGGLDIIGFGEGVNQRNAVIINLHTPSLVDGEVIIVPHDIKGTIVSKISSKGPHCLRIEKAGERITFSICVDYKGTFSADITHSVTDIKTIAPFLNAKNTYLSFARSGNFQGGVIFQEMRLVRAASKK